MERKRKPRHFWEEHARELKASGLSRRAYCDAHGLNRKTFDRWYRRILVDSEGSSGDPVTFVAVHARKSDVSRASSGSGPTLRCSDGVVLELPRDCDPSWLSQVLRGLR